MIDALGKLLSPQKARVALDCHLCGTLTLLLYLATSRLHPELNEHTLTENRL